jgi:hypothetical protein
VDVFNWFLHTRPTAIVANGGRDYDRDTEWYDNINVQYEWDYAWKGETRKVRGLYALLSTTSYGGCRETFCGDKGALVVSEWGRGSLWKEPAATLAPWELDAGVLEMHGTSPFCPIASENEKYWWPALCSLDMRGWYVNLPEPEMDRPVHWGHLENFFDAVRGKAKLACPAEAGFETCVSVLKANEALAAGRRLDLRPEDFQV